jgi:hypothetical protein
MAELADALGSGPSDRKVVEVRVLLSAPITALSFACVARAPRPRLRARGQPVRAPALRDAVLPDFIEQSLVADL